jgi:hypothetical protein
MTKGQQHLYKAGLRRRREQLGEYISAARKDAPEAAHGFWEWLKAKLAIKAPGAQEQSDGQHPRA